MADCQQECQVKKPFLDMVAIAIDKPTILLNFIDLLLHIVKLLL